MTVIPSDVHVCFKESMSRMFSDARYIAGVFLCSWAMFTASVIGDVRTLPAANQFSVSTTQKSGSLCVAMAWVSVITMSFSTWYV